MLHNFKEQYIQIIIKGKVADQMLCVVCPD